MLEIWLVHSVDRPQYNVSRFQKLHDPLEEVFLFLYYCSLMVDGPGLGEPLMLKLIENTGKSVHFNVLLWFLKDKMTT